jgi:transposase
LAFTLLRLVIGLRKGLFREFGEQRWVEYQSSRSCSREALPLLSPIDLLSLPPELSLTDAFLTPDLVVALAASAPSADSPICGEPSNRVHSRYPRTLADWPVSGRQVMIRLTARKFFCRQPECPRGVFCERLPGLVRSHARTTCRLDDSHREFGFALGGETGARSADALGMPTSPNAVLRRVKGDEGLPAAEPRFVGVDDWAWRKGQNQGTILVDLERGRVIDLLPG